MKLPEEEHDLSSVIDYYSYRFLYWLNANPGQGKTMFCNVSGLSTATLTRRLAGLEELGLIHAFHSNPKRNNIQPVFITEKGRAVLKDLNTLVQHLCDDTLDTKPIKTTEEEDD